MAQCEFNVNVIKALEGSVIAKVSKKLLVERDKQYRLQFVLAVM